MRRVRFTALVALSIAASEGAAQDRPALSIELNAGPSYRVLGSEVTYARDGFNAYSMELVGGIPLGMNLRAIVGAGVLMTPNPNVNAPLPPGATPPVEPLESVSHLRLGLGYERGRLRIGAGAVMAYASDGFEKDRSAAPFADLQVRPSLRTPITIGVFAYQFPRTVGGYRALVTPTIGLRF